MKLEYSNLFDVYNFMNVPNNRARVDGFKKSENRIDSWR